MKELLKRKQHGEKIEVPKERAPSKVVILWRRCGKVLLPGVGREVNPRSVQCSTAREEKRRPLDRVLVNGRLAKRRKRNVTPR
jgi:hypothetical protein